jgi:type IV pilus assembly protein PilA
MVLKKQLKKNRKKGFTLVEVIVVLVILAVLAAIAIPALTGYIDKANDRAALSEARSVTVALQEIVSEEYGDGNGANVKGKANISWTAKITNSGDSATVQDRVNNLTGATYASVSAISTSGTAISQFAYEIEANKFVGYKASRTPKYKLAATENAALAD